MEPRPETPSPRRALLVLTAVALAVRVYIQLLSPVIAADSAVYLDSALLMREGKFFEGLDFRGLHPLFPMATALVGMVFSRLETAGTIVSVAAGAATVLPLFALFSMRWTRREALTAGLVYALHPVLAPYTSEAVPTALFLLCFCSALAFGLRALEDGSALKFALAGACSALAYLTRTEGLAAGFFLVIAAGAALRWPAPGASRQRILLGAMIALAAGAALAIPYIVHLSRNAGRFAITAKGAGTVLLHAMQGEAVIPPDPTMSNPYLLAITHYLPQAFFPPLLPFLIAGLYWERKNLRRHLALLLLGAAALAPTLVVFALNRYFRSSPRYFLAGVTLLLPWVAAAMLRILDELRRRFPASRAAVPVTAGLLLLLLCGKYLLPHRAEEKAYRESGAWIAAHPPAARPWKLVSSSDKLSWYAGALNVPFLVPPANAPAATLRLCKETGAPLLAVDSASIQELGGPAYLEGLEQSGFTRLESFSAKARGRELTVWIYRRPSP